MPTRRARLEGFEMDWQSSDSAPKDGTWILIRGRNAVGQPMIPIAAAWVTGGLVDAPDKHIAWRSGETGRDLGSYMSDGWDWMPIVGESDNGK